MPVTYTSSISSGILIVAGGAPENDDYDLFNLTSDTTAAMGDVSGSATGGSSATAVADATAFGTDTLSSVSGTASIVEGSSATTISIDLEALAAAQAAGDVALAMTYLDVTYIGGGGGYMSIGHNTTSLEIEDGLTTAVSTSSIALVVIEFTGDGTGASYEIFAPDEPAPSGSEASTGSDGCGCQGSDDLDLGVQLDGNLSEFAVQLVAAGDNSYADLLLDAFVVEDAMSATTIILSIAVA